MKDLVDARRRLRASNPVPDSAFPGAAADSLGRVTFDRIVSSPRRPPAEADRRLRRRQLAWRSAAGGALLAACAAVLVLVLVQVSPVTPGAGGGHPGSPVTDTAYVVKHVDSALSSAGSGKVAQLTVTTAGSALKLGGAATGADWSYGDEWRSITYSAAGHPVYDEGFSTSSAYTLVNYETRTWARGPGVGGPVPLLPRAPGSRSCEPVVAALSWLFQPGLPGSGLSAGSLGATVRALRAAISCGTLAEMPGRHSVDGVETIELTSRAGSLIPETIWVSAGTYLPVRVQLRPGPGLPIRRRTADITWLPSTAENLAKLTVPIPAGFRQVPLAEAGEIVLPRR